MTGKIATDGFFNLLSTGRDAMANSLLVLDDAIRLANEILADRRGDALPVDICDVARGLGVVEIAPRPLNVDGYLGTTNRGELVIRYNEANDLRRNRFTIAHEVGHILLARATGQDLRGRVNRTWIRGNAEERMADRLAAELLMPMAAVQSHVLRVKPAWSSIFEMCAAFQVSLSAMVWRMLEIRGLAALFFQIDRDTPGSSNIVMARACLSKHLRARLCCSPMIEAKGLVAATLRGGRHLVRVRIDNSGALIPSKGFTLRRSRGRQIWAIGWIPWGNI